MGLILYNTVHEKICIIYTQKGGRKAKGYEKSSVGGLSHSLFLTQQTGALYFPAVESVCVHAYAAFSQLPTC